MTAVLLTRRTHPLIVLTRYAFDPGKHRRVPKGSAGGGRFMKMVDLIQAAIKDHQEHGGGEGHPFDGFTREQLRRVAKERGIELTRGESQDSIGRKLIDHLGQGGGHEPTGEGAPTKKAAPPRKKKTPAKPEPAPGAPAHYRELTPEDAQAMQDRMGSWTPEQAHALKFYTGSNYKDVNYTLRGVKGKVYTPASPAAVQRLRDALHPIPEDILVHREVGGAAFGLHGPVGGWAEAAHALVGRTWHDPAFTSTSVLPRSGIVSLHISAPKGTRGAYVQSLTQFSDEHEMLLDAGTHFRIDRVERSEHGWEFHMTVVRQDD